MEMQCPADKMGHVIGKNGAMAKKIEEKASVSLDIDAEKGIITISGSPAAFPAAKAEIEKIVNAKDEEIDVTPQLVMYLTNSRAINALESLREENPDVYFDVTRKSKTIQVRGHPDDIAKFKGSLRDLGVVSKNRELTATEANLVIGKKGASIERIISNNKAAIDIEKKSEDLSVATVAGPEAAVDAALAEIESFIDANKETSAAVPVDKATVQAFLTNSGVKVKELQKKVSEATKAEGAGTILLSFDDATGNNSKMVIRGKPAALDIATEMVKEAIREVDSSTIRLMADKHAIPQIIGKGGENIKKLRDGKTVNIEVDRNSGEIAINGPNEEEVAEVKTKIEEIIAQNKVQKVPGDASLIEAQYRELIRSKTRNEITELARLDIDKKESTILLRGTDENVHKAAELVKAFLDENFIETIEITDADKDALLSGGQKSKIVSLAKELEVNLSVDREKSALIVRGPMDKVQAAVKHIRTYLYGGEGYVVSKIAVSDEAIGIIIGKGGKTRTSLEAKHPGVSIYIHRTKDAITIRGPEEETNACRFEILKMIASARIQKVVPATETEIKELNKSNLVRRVTEHIPVQIVLADTTITIRGVSSDVNDAVALLKEHLTGVYESTIELGSSQFAKIQTTTTRDSSHFARMKQATGADLSLNTSTNSIVISGKKNNVKKAKFQVLDLIEFLLPGEFAKIKVPKAMHTTVGAATSVTDVGATSGASVCLDRDLSMVLIHSADKEEVDKAIELVQVKIAEAEKLVYVVEFETTEAWIIPALIGKNGSHVNKLRKDTGCTIDVSKEERTVVVSGTSEEAVAKARAAIDSSIEKTKKETVFVDIPSTAMPNFVGRGGARISEFAQKYNVEIQNLRKGPSMVRINGEETKVQEAKAAVIEWVMEWSKEAAVKEIPIQRHQIAPILGAKGANIQAMEREFGCKIDLNRDRLLVTLRGGDEAKQEMAQKKIEEIMAENPVPERRTNASMDSDDDMGEPEQPASKKKEESKPRSRASSTDSEERIDRSSEFPSLPIGVAPASGGKKRRKRKPKAVTAAPEVAPVGKSSQVSPGLEESSVSDVEAST